MRAIGFHPEAKAELDYASIYYEVEQPGLGEEFLAEAERTFAHIASFPESGSEFRRTGCRKFGVRRFPYVIVYDVLPDSIRIVAVAHGKQRPGYWRKRRFESVEPESGG